jgi:flagellar hook-basal body complex protein FliE
MINSIGPAGLRQAQAFPGSQLQGVGGPATGASFGDTLRQALAEISTVQENAQEVVSAFLRGEQVELHQVMAAAEEAGIALEMLIEIRNKFTEAYRTVINIQG